MEAAANLPPWIQWVGQISVFLLALLTAVVGIRKGTEAKETKEEKDLAPGEVLGNPVVVKFFSDVSDIAVSMRMIAESGKVVSAASEKWAREIDKQFRAEEIDEAVERRLERERRLRRVRSEGKSPEDAPNWD